MIELNIPGVTPDHKSVLATGSKVAGIAIGASLAAWLVGKIIGDKGAKVIYAGSLLFYGAMRSSDDMLLAVGLTSVGLHSFLGLLLAGLGNKVMPAGALPRGVSAFTPVPYQSVPAWG